VQAVLRLPITEAAVKDALHALFRQQMADAQVEANVPHLADALPRQATSEQVHLQTYVSWVRARDLALAPAYLKCKRLSFQQV
jgi:hypothetical protein